MCSLPPPHRPVPPTTVQVPMSLPLCPQALRVNRLEQLCNNLASERLQLFSSRLLWAQEEVWGTGPGGGQGRPGLPDQGPSLGNGRC